MLLERPSAQECEVFEDAETECEECDIVEINAEFVAKKDEERGHESIREEAADEDFVIEFLVDGSAQTTKNGVERREDGNRKVFRER